MAKPVIIFDNTMSKESSHLTHYCKLISNLAINENVKKFYHGFQLKQFKSTFRDVREQYPSSVTNFCKNVEKMFSDIKKPAISKNIKSILDTFTIVLTEITLFLAMMPLKNSVSVLRVLSWKILLKYVVIVKSQGKSIWKGNKRSFGALM